MPSMTTRRTPSIPGRPVRLTPEKESELITAFNNDLMHSWQGKQPRTELALQATKAYRAHLESKSNSIFYTSLYVPVIFSAIETAVSAEWKALFSYPFLEYIPRNAADQVDCEQAAYYNDCFDYHWAKNSQVIPITDLLRQRRLYGGAFAIHYWKEEYRDIAAWGDSEVRTFEDTGKNDEFGNPVFAEYVDKARTIVSEKRRVIDSPWWDVIHFLEAFPDWEVRPNEFQSSRYFIHLKPRSKEYIKRRFKSGVWKHKEYDAICESKGYDGSSLGGETSDSVKNWQVILGQVYNNSSETSQGGMHEVAEYYRPEGVYTILDRKWIVLARKGFPMGRIPISYIPNYPDPAGGFWGISDFELVRSSNNHIQNMANASGTEAILGVFPLMVAGPSVDKSQIRVRPGHVITSPNGTQDINFLVRPSAGIQVADAQKAASLATIDDTLGTSEVVRGALPSRETSATAVAQSVNSASRRMELNTAIIGELFIRPLGEFYRDMINLMQTEEISAQMRESSKTRIITPDQLQDPDLDCRPVSNLSNLRELEKKQLMEFMTVCSQLGIKSIDLDAVARIYAQHSLPKYAAEISRNPEEAEVLRQAQQMEMQTQNAAGPESTGAAPPSNEIYDDMEGEHSAASRDQASAMSL